MATKTYQSVLIHFSGIFHLPSGPKRITFAGSTNNSRGIYTTADTSEQAAIENSQKFYDKEIYLFREYDDKEPEKEEENNIVIVDGTEGLDRSIRTFPDVKNVQSAAKILRDKFGAKPEEVNNKPNMLAKAKELGVTFPDIKA